MSTSTQTFPYFTSDEAQEILNLEGKKFVKANQLFWENRSDPAEHLTLLIELELVFEDGTSVSFYAEEERSGLAIGKIDRLREDSKIRELGSVFVKMRQAVEDEEDNWEPFLGESIVGLEMRPAGPGIYMNDGFIVDFGFTKVLISRPLDAIEVEELVNEDEDEVQ